MYIGCFIIDHQIQTWSLHNRPHIKYIIWTKQPFLAHIKLRSRSTNLLDMFIVVFGSSSRFQWIPTTLVGSQWFLNLLSNQGRRFKNHWLRAFWGQLVNLCSVMYELSHLRSRSTRSRYFHNCLEPSWLQVPRALVGNKWFLNLLLTLYYPTRPKPPWVSGYWIFCLVWQKIHVQL